MTGALLEVDALIAGGGHAGLAMTARLAAAGLRVLCVERGPETIAEDDLRTIAVMRPGAETLRAAGAWEDLLTHATPLRVMRVLNAGADGRVTARADFDSAEIGGGPFGWNIPAPRLRAGLLARVRALPGAQFLAQTEISFSLARKDAALATLSDGRRVRAQVTIAADGRDSALRAAAGVSVSRQRYDQSALVCAVAHDDADHEEVSTEIHMSGGPFTLVPMGGRRSAVVWMDSAARIAGLQAMSDSDFLAALNARSCGVLGSLRPLTGRAVWPMILQSADRLIAPRLALIAEAAHVMPPIGAQGLNTSLRDVEALARVLLEARLAGRDLGDDRALRRYAQTREKDMRMRLTAVDALNRISIFSQSPMTALRAGGIRTLASLPPIRSAMMRIGLGAQ